tara:strand:+ start:356 stop:715 length:360 start_codon:yes stop_codon:yes gene_type:complete
MRTVEELIAEYESHGKAFGDASKAGKYEISDASGDEMVRVFLELRSRGEEQALKALLSSHRDRIVRCWAATHLLHVEAEPAVRVLEALSSGSDMVALTAETVLSEWRNGTLSPPELSSD